MALRLVATLAGIVWFAAWSAGCPGGGGGDDDDPMTSVGAPEGTAGGGASDGGPGAEAGSGANGSEAGNDGHAGGEAGADGGRGGTSGSRSAADGGVEPVVVPPDSLPAVPSSDESPQASAATRPMEITRRRTTAAV